MTKGNHSFYLVYPFMYFAVLGKNSEISMAELQYVQPRNIKPIWNNIITFDSDFPDHIQKLG